MAVAESSTTVSPSASSRQSASTGTDVVIRARSEESVEKAKASIEKQCQRLDDPHYTTELGLFNLELNADPQPFAGKGLAQMEAQLNELYVKVQRISAELEVQPVLTGISSGQFGPQANLAADGGWAVANICFFGFFGAFVLLLWTFRFGE